MELLSQFIREQTAADAKLQPDKGSKRVGNGKNMPPHSLLLSMKPQEAVAKYRMNLLFNL